MSSKITVGKIVATTSETSWSQAYHAGGFTAVLSITSHEEHSTSHELQTTGKELLDTLVSEYFTLTTKDLETVKGAIEATIRKVPKHIEASLVVAAVIKNILYVVVADEGKALLKRGEKVGVLLEVKPEDTDRVASVSGFLESGDIVLLTTPAFNTVVSHEDIVMAFERDNAEEIAEILAAPVHKADNGAAAGLVFFFHEDEAAEAALPIREHSHGAIAYPLRPKEGEEPEEKSEIKGEEPVKDTSLPGFIDQSPTGRRQGFSHHQKLFLTIAVILAAVLIGSVVIFQQRQQSAKLQQEFQAVYAPAKAKYDEGQGLLQLNKSMAISDFQSAEGMLNSTKGTFPASSTEGKQIAILLGQVATSLTSATKIPVVTAVKAPDNASPLLSFVAKQNPTFFAEDATNFYTADTTGITQYDQKTNAKKVIIKNNNDYKTIGGFDEYFGNFYIADTTSGIVKYVAGSGGYGSSAYFASGVTPDLSKVVSLTIDGSIWLLSSDGIISKYTRGTQDSFTVSGLDTPLKNPTQILTGVNFANVYVFDKGNGRVIELKKDGSFIAQYPADVLSSATAIDVSENDKKIYILSNGTIYQLDLK